ncbi:MAG: hypothetical protein ACI9W1_002294, partial [Candidatus Azotimanducaceae bacterium]
SCNNRSNTKQSARKGIMIQLFSALAKGGTYDRG